MMEVLPTVQEDSEACQTGKDSLIAKLNESLIHVVINNNNNNINGNNDCLKKVIDEVFVKLYGKEVEALEKKYQEQVDQLSTKLAEKQQESSSLRAELDEIKQAQLQDRSQEIAKDLQSKVEQLTKKITEKDIALDGIRLGLQQAKNDAENSKTKIRRLEDELKSTRQTHLSGEEQTKAKFATRIGEFEGQIKSLEDQLEKSQSSCRNLQQNLDEIEEEREEELKIVQDALDEAAQEREDLIAGFKKELEHANNMNAAREQQMLEDFEWKLSEMEKDHKKKLDEKERQAENTLTRPKRHMDDEDVRTKVEKIRSEINAEWEDKLRSECQRLKKELDELHAEEKHLAVESIKVQKDQELLSSRSTSERKIEELNKTISTLKDRLAQKEAYYHTELESARTTSDRDIWSLRMKLQKLDESSHDKIQQMEENNREEIERLKTDYIDRIKNLESRLSTYDEQAGLDVLGQLNKEHKEQLEHLEEQHKLSMERFIEESDSEKFQAVEEARVILTRNHEDIENGLRDQLAEALSTCANLREEVDALKADLANKDDEDEDDFEEEEEESLKSHCDSSALPLENPAGTSCTSSGISSSQYSLASSSNGSRLSQDRISLSELSGVASESHEDGHKNPTNGSLLGKVFGGGWFPGSKSKEGRRGSTPSNKRISST